MSTLSYGLDDALGLRHGDELTAPVPSGLRVSLQRFGHGRSDRHVLLVHGASAGSRTFMVPDGGLVKFLVAAGWDVWTLDWRGSNRFQDFNPKARSSEHQPAQLSRYAEQFDLDRSASEDLPAALVKLKEVLGSERPGTKVELSVVAHCIGGAITAQAIAAGCLDEFRASRSPDFQIKNFVLTTLALFYRVDIDGWLKGHDHMLESLLHELDEFTDPDHPVISPWAASTVPAEAVPWPTSLENMFELWQRSPMPHSPCESDFCKRASFMFGIPYRCDDMKGLHDSKEGHGLWLQFGNMPLKMYMHCVRNLRRGFAARYDDHGDKAGDSAGHARPPRVTDDVSCEGYVNPLAFVGDDEGPPPWSVTLITGAQNQVWHRDSIDRMHEWLINHARHEHRGLFVKHVLPGYGHQDLYWSSNAASEVYGKILAGMSRMQ
jgi:alpha/beta hydrolase family protein